MDLESKIEGLLFYKGEDVSIKKLASILGVSEGDIEESLKKLENSLIDRGLVLVRKNDSVVMGINSELSPLIESIRKEEIAKDLSRATLETLSIVLYKNGVTRSEVDYIRGVNSSFILRNLLIRGLIEKSVDKNDSRRFLYYPTFETLSYMNITSLDQLPKYQEILSQLEEVIKQTENDG
jgi:segregation and condensation protein B